MRARGYSLPFVIMILILISVALATLLFVLSAGAKSTESMLGRRRLFYACDGASRIAAISAQNYFGQTDSPSATALRTFVCDEGGGCAGAALLPTFMSQTPGFEITKFEIPRVGQRTLGPIDSGPFEGMIALQDNLDLTVAAKKQDVGWACEVTQELSLGKISMFQFFVFSDQPYTDWLPGPEMLSEGRVHANGDLCIFGDPGPLYLERATASGRILPSVAGGCKGGSVQNGNPSPARVAIVSSPSFSPLGATAEQTTTSTTADFRKFSTRADSWIEDANVLFKKHLQDTDHNVTPLLLPVFGTSTIQSGVDAGSESTLGFQDNDLNSRILVEPIGVGIDDPGASQKFAFKADIRIINGVWFKRDLDNPEAPGIPMWSDHPGLASTHAESNAQTGSLSVGQGTLFPSGTVPTGYSMYTFAADGTYSRAAGVPDGVISYGTLFRDGASPPVWAPGYRCAGTVRSLGDSACGLSTKGERVMAGTRSGIRNGMAQVMFGASDARANLLPINFDVAAFHRALASCSNNELGSHFKGSCSAAGRKFNGIVYLTSTWPGSNAEPASVPPAQGAISDGDQPGTGSGGEQTAIPYPLCSTSLNQTNTSAGGFKHTSCSRYVAGQSLQNARPTAVRVFNARGINTEHPSGRPAIGSDAVAKAVLTNGIGKDGLTIATNLPIYVLGDANLTSAADSTNASDHWRPFLVAGDVVNLLSNAWNDTAAPWGASLSDVSGTVRKASPTTYHMEILAGWVPTSASRFSGGVHNFPKQLEHWSGVDLTFRGSLVIGWAAVYSRWRHAGGGPAFIAPVRDWRFDRHLENILNQPPGAPLYDVQSTRRWKR